MLNTCRPTRRERHRRYGWRGLLRPRAAPLESICYTPALRAYTSRLRLSRRCELSHSICYMLHGVARVEKYSLATCPVVDVEGYDLFCLNPVTRESTQ